MARRLERYLLFAGTVLLAVYGVARIAGNIAARHALQEFDVARKAAEASGRERIVEGRDDARPDFALWSQQRIRAYRASLQAKLDPPMAVLSIPKVGLRVPVFDGTGDLTLNRGAGWIAGTARPGERGNIGIAGHRDGFFRGLKDVRAGDEIDLDMIQGTERFFVGEERVVGPDDVSVLGPRAIPTLTLVTCYPFYYVGSAPQRFVVTAFRAQEGKAPGQESPLGQKTPRWRRIRK